MSPATALALLATVVAATVATVVTAVLPWTTTTTAAVLLVATALVVTTTAVVPHRLATTTTPAMTATDRHRAVEALLSLMTTLRLVATSTTATALPQAHLLVAAVPAKSLTHT